VSDDPERSETSNGSGPANGNGPARPSLNAAVLRRRADRDFYLRLRDAIQQNHRALQRLGR
jgi:hypothetical protein